MMEDPDQLSGESYEQEDIMEELTQGIGDELLEDIIGTDSSEDLAETNPQELITQLQSRIKTLEGRLSQLEKKPSGKMQSGRALEEYRRFMDQAKEMAKEKLEQKKNDNLTYNRISMIVRGTEDMDIEYGVEGQVRKDHIGHPYPPFEDTEILKVPKAIKKALRGQEES